MKHIARKSIAYFSAVLILVGGLAFGQAGRGVGRVGGVVYDLEEKPVGGVKLTLQFSDNANLKFEATSNKKGEFSFLGLGTGNWTLTAIPTGYMPQDKTLYVSQLSHIPLTFSIKDGVVIINNAKVAKTDIACSNGVIHVIDTVVLPK